MTVKYKQGALGRVFVLKFEDKDDILEEIKKVALKETIKVGTIMLLGGMRSAEMISGPKEVVIPPAPLWTRFNDGRDALGDRAPCSGTATNPLSISREPWNARMRRW